MPLGMSISTPIPIKIRGNLRIASGVGDDVDGRWVPNVELALMHHRSF